jgi:uncharacterized protein
MAEFSSLAFRKQKSEPASPLVSLARARPLTIFFLLAYAWSWSFWLIVPRLLLHRELTFEETVDLVIFLVGAGGPLVAALITRWIAYRDFKICQVWNGWSNLISGLVVGISAFFVATVLAPTIALVRAPLAQIHWSTLLQWSTYAVNYSLFLGGPVPEEPGWRGFALPKLQARFGPYWATVILAFFWAAWHLPLFHLHWSSASPWQFLLIIVGVSFLLTAAANLSKFNILVAIMLHACFNASSKVLNALLSKLPERSPEMTIYTLAVCGCGTLFGVVLLRLRKSQASPQPIE